MDTDKLINDLNQHLEKEFNIGSSTINLKVDKVCSKLLILAKKNYSYIENGEMKSKGLDYIKSSTLPLAAAWQKELLESILFRDVRQFDKILEFYRDAFFNMEFDEKNVHLVTLKMRVTKHPSKYASKSTPALVALWMIENKKVFYNGIMVPIIVTGVQDGQMVGVHPESNLWQGKVYKPYIWSNMILPKLSRITEILQPDLDWRQYDPEEVRLRDKRMEKYKKLVLDIDKYGTIDKKIENDRLLSPPEKKKLLEYFSKNKVQRLW